MITVPQHALLFVIFFIFGIWLNRYQFNFRQRNVSGFWVQSWLAALFFSLIVAAFLWVMAEFVLFMFDRSFLQK